MVGVTGQNGIVASFNGRLRDELLSSEIIETLAEARLPVDRWRISFSNRRVQRAQRRLKRATSAARCPALPPSRRPRSGWRRCTDTH
jgi:hypothetical protein